jgi:uncharacterized protein (DUF1684 family)
MSGGVFTVHGITRRPQRSQIDPNAYRKEIAQWQEQRWAELKSETGWLTLVGLFWLQEGANNCGSDPSLDIVLPKEKFPLLAGEFIVDKGSVGFVPVSEGFKLEGKSLPAGSKHQMLQLKSDADDKPTIVNFGTLSFQIIKRGDKFGLRVKDSQNADRLNFKRTEFYAADPNWRIDARFEPYNPPKPMPIVNVLGMESAESSPGAVVFEFEGHEYRLDAMTEKGDSRYFMILADKTSGKETYPAGRYLYVDPADRSGHVIIDFNKAYSPPCAFTKFATCPLPPRQNRLPVAIEAGEKYKRHAD